MPHFTKDPFWPVLLVVMFGCGVGTCLCAQTAGEEPAELQDEQSRPGVKKSAGILPPETSSSLPALVIIRETIDTNIVSWASAPGFGGKLDWLHMKTFRIAQAPVDMIDDWFPPGDGEKRMVELSRFRLGVFGQGVKLNGEYDVTAVLDLDTDIELPNMKRRTKLAFTTRDDTELPGRDITEAQDRSLRTAVERELWPAVSTSIGVRGRVPPELFANVAWAPKWKAGDWLFYPRQKIYWDSANGFGEISSFVVDRWAEGWNIRSTTAIKCSELYWELDRKTDRQDGGFRWVEVITFGYAKELLDETRIERIIDGDDVARGMGIRLTAFGGFSNIDEYRAAVFARWPIRKRWMYLLVSPDISWLRENNWDHEWTLRFGIEMLFWGNKSR